MLYTLTVTIIWEDLLTGAQEVQHISEAGSSEDALDYAAITDLPCRQDVKARWRSGWRARNEECTYTLDWTDVQFETGIVSLRKPAPITYQHKTTRSE